MVVDILFIYLFIFYLYFIKLNFCVLLFNVIYYLLTWMTFSYAFLFIVIYYRTRLLDYQKSLIVDNFLF